MRISEPIFFTASAPTPLRDTHPLAHPQARDPHLGRGRGPSGGASAELRLYSSDGGRGREDELRGQRNSAA